MCMTQRRFLNCHRISHWLKSLVISVRAHIAPSVQSSAFFPFCIVALPLYMGKETKEHWSPVLEVPFDLHWLNSVICCFTGQLLNMNYRCNVIKPIFLNFFVNRPCSRSRSCEHAVSPRNTEKRLGQREFTHRVQMYILLMRCSGVQRKHESLMIPSQLERKGWIRQVDWLNQSFRSTWSRLC